MTRVLFPVDCTSCPGDGVIRPARPGIDWPRPCPCGARLALTQYQLGRILEERPATIVRLDALRTTPGVSARILGKLVSLGLVPGTSS